MSIKFTELFRLSKQKEKDGGNQASISITSCTELSKTQLFLVIKVKEKIILLFYIVFWYRDFQATWEKLRPEK